MLSWVGPVFPAPPFSNAGWLSNSWSCQLRPKRCIAVKYTKKLHGPSTNKQTGTSTIKPLKNKRPVGEHKGWIQCRWRKNSLTSNILLHFFFLTPLFHGWFLCKHNTDRGQTKSFQSIPRNPVALACFHGECCSLMHRCLHNIAVAVSERDQIFFFDTKLSCQYTETWYILNCNTKWKMCVRNSRMEEETESKRLSRKCKAVYWGRQSQREGEMRG